MSCSCWLMRSLYNPQGLALVGWGGGGGVIPVGGHENRGRHALLWTVVGVHPLTQQPLSKLICSGQERLPEVQFWTEKPGGTYTDQKENKVFFIYKEIQMGSVAKSYMRKRKYLVIYMMRPLVIYCMTLQPIPCEFPYIWEEKNLWYSGTVVVP